MKCSQIDCDNNSDGYCCIDNPKDCPLNNNEKQIEKCIKLSADLWNEFLKLPVEHPNETDEFAMAIHSIQDKLSLRIARIYRPDLFPNKMC